MDALLSQLGNYGPVGVLAGSIILYLYTRLNKLEERIDKDNEWKMQVIENDTKATLGATAAQASMTETLKQLVASVDKIDRRIP